MSNSINRDAELADLLENIAKHLRENSKPLETRIQRKRLSENRSLRTAILAMFADRFSEEEIALGLECEMSEVVAVLVSDKRQRR